MQAKLLGHSWFMVHSGLHSVYGSPCKPGRHTQAAALFRSLHCALIPQGDGLHGSMISGAGRGATIEFS